MNVLSLFNGMSVGMLALKELGIKVDKYYSSEIEEIAIKVSNYNFPEIIEIGDITKVDSSKLDKIDLLIGGSPCQDFSRANKNRKGLKGDKSSLFWEWVRLWKETNPKYFFLENVRMEDNDMKIITETLGVNPIRINSELVSGQQRDRCYWTNIPGSGINLFGNYIERPKDLGITFQSILTEGYTPLKKSRCLLEGDSRPNVQPLKMW